MYVVCAYVSGPNRYLDNSIDSTEEVPRKDTRVLQGGEEGGSRAQSLETQIKRGATGVDSIDERARTLPLSGLSPDSCVDREVWQVWGARLKIIRTFGLHLARADK